MEGHHSRWLKFLESTASNWTHGYYSYLVWSRCSVVWKKDQRERDFALGQFKSGSIRTLVATDVAARGLDIKAQQFHGKKVLVKSLTKKERLGPLKGTCIHTESLDRLILNQKFIEFSFCSHHLWAAFHCVFVEAVRVVVNFDPPNREEDMRLKRVDHTYWTHVQRNGMRFWKGCLNIHTRAHSQHASIVKKAGVFRVLKRTWTWTIWPFHTRTTCTE